MCVSMKAMKFVYVAETCYIHELYVYLHRSFYPKAYFKRIAETIFKIEMPILFFCVFHQNYHVRVCILDYFTLSSNGK